MKPSTATTYDEFRAEYREWVRLARARLSMTQAQFATMLGVSTRSVQDWEHGVRLPGPKHRWKLERIMAVLESNGEAAA